MDLDDSFTEGLLQSVKARRGFINEKKGGNLSNSKKRASYDKDPLENSDVPHEESPKRQCTGVSQMAYSKHNKENIEMMDETTSDFVPYHSIAKTRGLAALRKQHSSDYDDDNFSKAPEQQETPTSAISPKKNVSEISSKKTHSIKPVPDSSTEDYNDHDESINEEDFAENYEDFKSDDGTSNMELDFSPSNDVKGKDKPNEPKKFETSKVPKLLGTQETIKTNVDPAGLPLSARKALFENAFINGTPKLNDVFDPKLSVAQRAAMFENATKANSSTKAANFKTEPKRMAFSNLEKFEKRNTDVHKDLVKSVQPAAKNNFHEIKASPVKQVLQSASPIKQTFQTASPVKQALQIASPVKQAFKAASPVKKISHDASPVKKIFQTESLCINACQTSPIKKVMSNSNSPILSPTKNVGSHTRLIQEKLMASTGSNWQGKQAAKAAEERKQEISSLVNHWEKLSSSSSTDNNSELEKAPLSSEEKCSYKSDTIYEPAETEDESEMHESENEYVSEDESKNNSVDVKENDTDEYDDVDSIDDKSEALNPAYHYGETKTESLTSVTENSERNFSDVSNHTDNNTRSFTSSSCYSDVPSTASDSNYHASASQSCSSGSSVRSSDFTHFKVQEVFLEKSEKRENKNPEINLLRTISAYRREKQETKLTPVRTVVRREKVSSPESPPDTDLTEVIQQRLKELQDEVLRQQIVISQTSQALNLCSVSAEFSGSTEQVEGERLLLIATQKRQACLNEIQRLKTCGAQGENVIDGMGTLTITDLQLPLKREFIASQLEGRGTDTVHYFLCLIRHGAQVIVTQMMSTDERSSDGALQFTNHIQLRNLPADFSVVFEVYALQTKKEVLPHDKKYHIKRENSKRRLTPKGKKTDNKIPAISSPGGPNAVRSPSFGVVGFTRFNLQNCNKRTFTLDKVPFASPLEGVLRVQIQLHAEHKVSLKGFLTFYEDVGEIGALLRRWCVLDSNSISYWLYPDDEHKKEPLGSIDLRQCVTGVVKSVPTIECARSHTFKLVTVRPQKKGEKDTLITKTSNTITTTKHLLTADTKDERILWCNKINEALENVRKWDPQALRPVESINI